MNSDHDNELEARIDRELRSLRELSAPPALRARVMARIARASALPWYQRSWQTWPAALQGVCLALLLGLSAATAFGVWYGAQSEIVLSGLHSLSGWLAAACALLNAGATLFRAAAAFIQHLGPGFMIACLLLLAFTYLACVGVGTVVVRLARHPRPSIL
jgi:hypothetical protein